MARFTGGGSGGGAGTAGAGYEFSWNADFGYPSRPSPIGYEDTVYGRIGEAYTEGNYVRFYYDKVNSPDAWYEGIVTSVSFSNSTAHDVLRVMVEAQGPATQGYIPDSTTTLNSELMLAGKPGADGAGYSFSHPSEMIDNTPIDFSTTSYGVAIYYAGILGEAFSTRDYVRVTFSNGEWIEGTLEIMSRDGLDSYFWVHVQRTHGTSVNDAATGEIASVRLSVYVVTENDAITATPQAVAAEQVYPGYVYMLQGNPAAYAVGDFIRFSADANNWLEGLVSNISPAYNNGNQNAFGHMALTVNKWSLPDGITSNYSNIFFTYPEASVRKLAKPGDTHILQELSESPSFNWYISFGGSNISESDYSNPFELFTINKTSETSSIKMLIQLNTYNDIAGFAS